jgi:hypothetical protein
MAGATLVASWKKVAEDYLLKRSSHAVAAIGGEVYVFGGELVARQPRDGDVHAVALDGGTLKSPKHTIIYGSMPTNKNRLTIDTTHPAHLLSRPNS